MLATAGNGRTSLDRCTLFGFGTGISAWSAIEVSHCAILNCARLYWWPVPQADAQWQVVLRQNLVTPGKIVAAGREYAPEQWAEYLKATGKSTASVVQVYNHRQPPFSPVSVGDATYGAAIDLGAMPLDK